jgi:hypothetical protein
MARASARRRQAQARRNNTPWMIGAVVVAGLAVVGLVMANMALGTQAATPPAISEGHTWGKANAPAPIEIFSDFQ